MLLAIKHLTASDHKGTPDCPPCNIFGRTVWANTIGLLIFCAVAEPRNSGKSTKFTKTHKILRNSLEILSNTVHVCTAILKLAQLLGVFTCCKLANLCQNFVTETCKQRSETTRRRLCCEKLGTSHDVKGFAIGSFLERIVVERANDDLC